ncbi:MAG TPA: DUF6084 family protein [Verrucomicrobiae bacterium]|nr:DUF6084 family protein [Verrucomicrobiae bacterium]
MEPAANGLTPLLHFKLQISNSPSTEIIQAVLLNAQIQIQCPQRGYTPAEKEKLVELFGEPERWGQTLRNKLWAHTNATFGTFSGGAEIVLPVSCTFDLNVVATKYFYALGGGDVSLLFLFSGSVFYATPDKRLQVERISWNKECVYRMPVNVWRELMDRHYPNSAWLSLRRDIFERLCAFKRENGIATWEETVERLLRETEIPGSRPNLSNSKLQVPTIQNSEFKTQNSKLPEEVVA